MKKLPHYHKDPLDRMIVSQAVCESLDLLNCEDQFDAYLSVSNQKRFW
ncbi:hypothetical protein [Dyadobacter beijingensis]|nr:hypothetical protein [Dyadobacter beijingensis]